MNEIQILGVIITVLCCCGISISAKSYSDVAKSTATRIRESATTKNNDKEHPLPLAGLWYDGAYTWFREQWDQHVETMTPAVQLSFIETGHHLLPAISFPDIGQPWADPHKIGRASCRERV